MTKISGQICLFGSKFTIAKIYKRCRNGRDKKTNRRRRACFVKLRRTDAEEPLSAAFKPPRKKDEFYLFTHDDLRRIYKQMKLAGS